MTQEEILEYIKRCAELLGLLTYEELGDNRYKMGKYTYTINSLEIQPKEWLIDLLCNPKNTGHFKFYSDWNLIIEVVKKILNICCNLDSMEMYYNITDAIPEKHKTVQAINQFLIWYNENKK